jgi:acyl carrier protein phosphodiesterase
MNFLAHLYLSGDDEKVITGNFIGDYVKGKDFLKYPEPVRKGIILHRQIDSFTDNHPVFREVRKLFRADFSLHSGVVTDLILDHFLASHWQMYSHDSLRKFAKRIHAVLLSNFIYLPLRVQGFLPILIKNRRLESYAQPEGIHQSLDIMSRYTSLPPKANIAIIVMNENFNFIQRHFFIFMHELIAFTEKESGIIINRPTLL